MSPAIGSSWSRIVGLKGAPTLAWRNPLKEVPRATSASLLVGPTPARAFAVLGRLCPGAIFRSASSLSIRSTVVPIVSRRAPPAVAVAIPPVVTLVAMTRIASTLVAHRSLARGETTWKVSMPPARPSTVVGAVGTAPPRTGSRRRPTAASALRARTLVPSAVPLPRKVRRRSGTSPSLRLRLSFGHRCRHRAKRPALRRPLVAQLRV